MAHWDIYLNVSLMCMYQESYPLTVNIRGQEEVTVYCLGDCTQRVAGLQGVVAIVNVCWVLKGQTSL